MTVINTINGLNDIPRFGVEKDALFNKAGIKIPNLLGLRRTDNNHYIGNCTPKYRPIQIDEMIETIDIACKGIDIKHTGYAENRTGSKLLIRSEIGEVGVGDDPIEGYIYTVIDHTGTSANKVIPSTIRSACTNILHCLRPGRGIMHLDTFDARVDAFRENIALNIEYLKNYKQIIESFRGRPFTEEEMREMVAEIFNLEEAKSARAHKKAESVVLKFKNGIGTEGKTAWDALNAVTEFETHSGKKSSTKFIRELTMKTLSIKAFDYIKKNYIS